MIKFLWTLLTFGFELSGNGQTAQEPDPMQEPEIMKMCARELADLPLSAGYYRPDANSACH